MSNRETPDIPGRCRRSAWLLAFIPDAEIIRLHIERDGASTVSIRLIGRDNGRVVTFTLERINDLSLDGEDVNKQNVIFSLFVDKIETGIRLTFSPCYGLAGHLTAEKVSVRLD